MIYVVKNEEILNKCDAWETFGTERMCRWAQDNGYSIIRTEITAMGDMVIWVQ